MHKPCDGQTQTVGKPAAADMSILLGIVDIEGGRVPDELWSIMCTATGRLPHDRWHYADVGHGFVGCRELMTTSSGDTTGRNALAERGNAVAVFDGRLDTREALVRKLGSDLQHRPSDAELVAAAYLKYGRQFADHLLGDFALAIVDQRGPKLVLARDHCGIRPLHYAKFGRFMAFSTTPHALAALPGVDTNVDDQWIADVLTLHKLNTTKTAIRGISSLLPAHVASLTDGSLQTHRYWSLSRERVEPPNDDEQCLEALSELLQESVRCRLDRPESMPIVSELSGGIDSSAVTGVAAMQLRATNSQIFSFSQLLHPSLQGHVYPGTDESQWIRGFVAHHTNIEHQPVYGLDQGVVESIRNYVTARCGPVRNETAIFSDELFARSRQLGARTILSGFGGDQMISSPALGWERELVHQGGWDLLRAELEFRHRHRRSWLRAAASLVRDTTKPFLTRNWQAQLSQCCVESTFAAKQGYPSRYYRDQVRRRWDRMHERDRRVLESGVITFRVEDTALCAAFHGLEYRYPLLDVRILEFCHALGAQTVRRPGIRRRLLREACRDLMPEPQRLRNDKTGATVPQLRYRVLSDKTQLKEWLDVFARNRQFRQFVDIQSLRAYIDHLQPASDDSTVIKSRTFFRGMSLGFWLEMRQSEADKLRSAHSSAQVRADVAQPNAN